MIMAENERKSLVNGILGDTLPFLDGRILFKCEFSNYWFSNYGFRGDNHGVS